jgi:hypothetical protein
MEKIMENKFKVGDCVICVDAGTNQHIKNGEKYTVDEVHFFDRGTDQWVTLRETANSGDYRASRFEIVKDNKHPHHDTMIAYANDCTLKIEVSTTEGATWHITSTPSFDVSFQYRLYKEPERVFPESSLSIADVNTVYDSKSKFDDSLKAIADAAVKQYILDSEKVK